jgi:hypothetical protein
VQLQLTRAAVERVLVRLAIPLVWEYSVSLTAGTSCRGAVDGNADATELKMLKLPISGGTITMGTGYRIGKLSANCFDVEFNPGNRWSINKLPS